jgi:hypothetical protein
LDPSVIQDSGDGLADAEPGQSASLTYVMLVPPSRIRLTIAAPPTTSLTSVLARTLPTVCRTSRAHVTPHVSLTICLTRRIAS